MRVVFILFLAIVPRINCSHFRGGSISWKYIGPGNKVEFKYRLSWALKNANDATWKSNHLNGTPFTLHTGPYNVTSTNVAEDWEQGEGTFYYNFPSEGPYNVSYTGGSWITLGFGSAGNWNIQTKVDLHRRSDTHLPNFSPISTSRAIYRVQYGCSPTIKVPMIDADGDTVKCRWSTSSEADSIANVLPNARLDPDTCRIDLTANSGNNYATNKWFAVALTIEDYPKSPITINGHRYSPSTPITETPMQFLIRIETMPLTNCNQKPVFVSPTPADGAVTIVKAGNIFKATFYVLSNVTLNKFDVNGQTGINYSTFLSDDRGRQNTWKVNVDWKPTSADKGTKIVCVSAEDKFQKLSETRCLTIVAWDVDPCDKGPCQNLARCTRVGYTDNYVCHCIHGYTGSNCEHEINECASNPCQHSGKCLDLIGEYRCHCKPGFLGSQCSTDINECRSNPCRNGGNCQDLVDKYTCTCTMGYTGNNCEIDIDDCLGYTCNQQGTCIDGISSQSCLCSPGFTGNRCQIDINECLSNPCRNNATCVDLNNGYSCLCSTGTSGTHCEKQIDHCHSNPCLHGGTCISSFDGFKCQCQVGRHGEMCEYIDNIKSKKCQDRIYTECDCVTTRVPTEYPKSYKIQSCFIGIGTGSIITIMVSVVWNMLSTIPQKAETLKGDGKRWDKKSKQNIVSITEIPKQEVDNSDRVNTENTRRQRSFISAKEPMTNDTSTESYFKKLDDLFQYK